MENESAFPTFVFTDERGVIVGCSNNGMTLRDYFAAKAMAALISQYPPDESQMWTLDGNSYTKRELAFRAYQHADAMLKIKEEE